MSAALGPPSTAGTPPPAANHGWRSRHRAGGSLAAHGEPMVWLTGGAVALTLAMILGLIVLIAWLGLTTFWPLPIVEVRTLDGEVYWGEVTRTETYQPGPDVVSQLSPEARARLDATGGVTERRLLRTGNRDLTGNSFVWVDRFREAAADATPAWLVMIERLEWGRFVGEPVAFTVDGRETASTAQTAWAEFERVHAAARARRRQRERLETDAIGAVNHRIESARLALRTVDLARPAAGPADPAWGAWEARRAAAAKAADEAAATGAVEFARLRAEIDALNRENARHRLVLKTSDGQRKELALDEIVLAYPANQLGLAGKWGVYLSRWIEFLTDDPREANSEGGVFPAIFGTVAMTLIMCVAVVPFGVLAALYLREYAKGGLVVSTIRIAIGNLAGVPSIVFGVFGFGFFCYGVGSFIDGGPQAPWAPLGWTIGLVLWTVLLLLAVTTSAWRAATARTWEPRSTARRLQTAAAVVLWLSVVGLGILIVAQNPFFEGFFAAQLPNPTFGKGALIWASLTLALMTLPVVIVATEEALAAVPNSMREGSYGCGASKWQTIRRIVLPRAMPGIMTGMILAMARGAGEVAPLMLVGAVKIAPELPIDGTFPFLHPHRSFMHLGFHIYDLGFQSPDSEAAKPMVFTTTLLLFVVIAFLNCSAIWVRSRLRRQHVSGQF